MSYNLQSATWNFDDVTLNVGESLEFRFYMYDAGSSCKWGLIDSVKLCGHCEQVPEPMTAGLLAVGGVLAGIRSRRRRA